MKSKNNLFSMICFFVVFGILFQNPIFSESIDKLILQNETQKILDELDGFSSSDKSLNALFTDQSKGNIEIYKQQYYAIEGIIHKLEIIHKEWEEKLKEDRNDKIYRVFTATVELALCSIYSRPNKYLSFMKVADRLNINPQFQKSNQNTELLTFREKSGEWAIKLESLLSQARGNINKALNLKGDYIDAKILEAQLLVLEGNYDEALLRLENLDNINNSARNKDVFKEKRSFYNSWKAFAALKKGNRSNGLELLRRASIFSEPRRNAEWASVYRKLLNESKSKWIALDFNDIELLDEGNLENLKQRSIDAVEMIKMELQRPLNQIPDHPNKEKLAKLVKEPNSTVLMTLDTDKSENNLNHHSKITENLYRAGEKLAKCMKEWNELAEKNENVSYYYLINKASCGLILLHMAKSTDDFVKNENLRKKLKQRTRFHDTKIDYAAKWQEWLKYTESSLSADINKIIAMKGDIVYSKILAFEYEALFSSPQKALDRLNLLSKQLKKYGKRKILALPGGYEINAKAYIASWRSFLLLKAGDLKRARKVVEDTKELTDLKEWKSNQEKLIYLHSVPKVK